MEIKEFFKTVCQKASNRGKKLRETKNYFLRGHFRQKGVGEEEHYYKRGRRPTGKIYLATLVRGCH